MTQVQRNYLLERLEKSLDRAYKAVESNNKKVTFQHYLHNRINLNKVKLKSKNEIASGLLEYYDSGYSLTDAELSIFIDISTLPEIKKDRDLANRKIVFENEKDYIELRKKFDKIKDKILITETEQDPETILAEIKKEFPNG